jgi:hypothetical protein
MMNNPCVAGDKKLAGQNCGKWGVWKVGVVHYKFGGGVWWFINIEKFVGINLGGY